MRKKGMRKTRLFVDSPHKHTHTYYTPVHTCWRNLAGFEQRNEKEKKVISRVCFHIFRPPPTQLWALNFIFIFEWAKKNKSYLVTQPNFCNDVDHRNVGDMNLIGYSIHSFFRILWYLTGYDRIFFIICLIFNIVEFAVCRWAISYTTILKHCIHLQCDSFFWGGGGVGSFFSNFLDAPSMACTPFISHLIIIFLANRLSLIIILSFYDETEGIICLIGVWALLYSIPFVFFEFE